MMTRFFASVALAAVALAAVALAAIPAAAQDQSDEGSKPATTIGKRAIVVVGQPKKPAAPPPMAKLNFMMREVDGPTITVTKKTSITKLDTLPPILDSNSRQLFEYTPGLFVSEQQTPTQFNLSYRGIGNPQESEYVLVLQDGLPIESDWIGFPTIYYMPVAQSLSEVQLIRGGASLIYGPEVAPAINLVSRRPAAGAPWSFTSQTAAGSDSLFSTYDAVEGSLGDVTLRADGAFIHSDGDRTNGDYRVRQEGLYLGWRPTVGQLWYLDLHDYDATSGDPGRLSYAQFKADPDQAVTPFNRDWVARTTITLGNQIDLGGHWTVETKLWAGWERLYQRSAANGAVPTSTTLVDEQFHSQGIDLRAVKHWGKGNALTLGAVGYQDSAPYHQWSSPDVMAARYDENGTPILAQARKSKYLAVFGENVFRLPHRWHIVPSFRLDHEVIDIDETVRPPFLTRPLIVQSAERTKPMFGLGAGFDFGHQNETYFNVSQGYRPLRFFDVASPFSNIGPGNIPVISKSLSWEAGVHGTPLKGLFYDTSLFWIDFTNRIETIVISPTESVYQNSGNSRSRGFEGELSYDFLAGRKDGLHLIVDGSASLLDATFTKSDLGYVGNKPAFSPTVTAKYGISLKQDGRFNFRLSGTTTSSQYFQDSNLPVASPGVTGYVPALIPAATVMDLGGEISLSKQVKATFSISNLLDNTYYNRVFQNGIEPGRPRTFLVGVELGLK